MATKVTRNPRPVRTFYYANRNDKRNDWAAKATATTVERAAWAAWRRLLKDYSRAEIYDKDGYLSAVVSISKDGRTISARFV